MSMAGSVLFSSLSLFLWFIMWSKKCALPFDVRSDPVRFPFFSPMWLLELVGPFTGLHNELLIIPGPHQVSLGPLLSLLLTEVGMVTAEDGTCMEEDTKGTAASLLLCCKETLLLLNEGRERAEYTVCRSLCKTGQHIYYQFLAFYCLPLLPSETRPRIRKWMDGWWMDRSNCFCKFWWILTGTSWPF